MKNTTLSLLFLTFFSVAFASNHPTEKEPICLVKQQANDTVIIYAEVTSANNYAQLHAFVSTLEADSTKFVSVVYNYEASEFTVVFTAQITKLTVMHIFKEEYGQIKVRN
ncbi:MAG: hypothetical protein WC044_00115 [Crocinitomicaceae bacterium]